VSYVVLGQVWAYFKVAAKRFPDNVQHAIHSNLLSRFPERLRSDLYSLASDEHKLADLMREDADVARHRQVLQGQVERLRRMRQTLCAGT
jgi:uncharacterized membrane protein YccC